MRGEYRGNRGARPRDVCRCDDDGATSARLYVCAGCRHQVLICSYCDRGQIYCAGDCAPQARLHSVRAAGRRYQTSRRGRLAHAARARRYRARGKKVTHHGSPLRPPDDLLTSGSPAITSDATARADRPSPSASHCHWCGRRCWDLVRQVFLRRRLRRRRGIVRHDRTGRGHGDST
jgi:hypothetical protein